MEWEKRDIAADAAASVLLWWSDAGVDVLVEESPRDWLKPQPKAPAAVASSAPPLTAPPQADEAPPEQLGLFRAWLAESDKIPLASPSAPRVCPSGNPESGLMILTDMPTYEDCSAGTLMSGEAGRLFDRMLAAIGRDRDSIYLAALSCLRSPDGRLNTEATKSCVALARHHAGLVAPKALLIFGDSASKALLGFAVPQARGRWHEIATHAGPVRALVTLSPSYLLTHPAAKAQAWADLQMLIEEVT